MDLPFPLIIFRPRIGAKGENLKHPRNQRLFRLEQKIKAPLVFFVKDRRAPMSPHSNYPSNLRPEDP